MTLDKQVTNSGGFDVYALGTASAGVAGSTLVLCYAYTSNYVFAVGTLTLHGPTAEDFTCPMTVACSIQLSGTGFANTNNVKVQGSGTTCSSGATAATGYTGMTLDKQVTNSGGFDVYALGTASAGVAVNNLVLCFA